MSVFEHYETTVHLYASADPSRPDGPLWSDTDYCNILCCSYGSTLISEILLIWLISNRIRPMNILLN